MDQATRIIMTSIFGGIFIALVICVPVFSLIKQLKKQEDEFCDNHKRIYPGMSRKAVVDLLGDQYTRSFLKNDIEKLEWRLRHGGVSVRAAKGVYAHSNSFTRRISVKFKDGKVIEVNALNMD